MPVTFQLTNMTKDTPETEVHSSFKDALADFYACVNEAVEKGTSFQWLETAIWISVKDASAGLEAPIYFYDARDVAFKYGLISDDGKTINKDGQNPDDDVLIQVAMICALKGGAEDYIKSLPKAA